MAGLRLKMKMVNGNSVICPHCKSKSVTVIDSIRGPAFFCNKCYFHLNVRLTVIEIYSDETFKVKLDEITGEEYANG